jgi:hypothetical protein
LKLKLTCDVGKNVGTSQDEESRDVEKNRAVRVLSIRTPVLLEGKTEGEDEKKCGQVGSRPDEGGDPDSNSALGLNSGVKIRVEGKVSCLQNTLCQIVHQMSEEGDLEKVC